MMEAVYPRQLTVRERVVLDALLTVEFDGVEELRSRAASAEVFGGCGCGCRSIDFFDGRNDGMTMVVNASVKDSATYDGLFLFTVHLPDIGDVLGGIEWVGQDESDPDELPSPENLLITAAGS